MWYYVLLISILIVAISIGFATYFAAKAANAPKSETEDDIKKNARTAAWISGISAGVLVVSIGILIFTRREQMAKEIHSIPAQINRRLAARRIGNEAYRQAYQSHMAYQQALMQNPLGID